MGTAYQPSAGHLMHVVAGLIRSLIAAAIIGITCILGAVGALLRPGPDFASRVKRWGGRTTLRATGVGHSLEGLEHVPAAGGFVLISNHESHYDGPFLVGWFPRDFSIVAKAELFRIPVLGTGFRAFGFIKVNRADRTQAVATMDAATTYLQNGGGVLVFVEGHRTETGELQEFKKGGFVMALKAGVPLIPVAIAGTREVLPIGTLWVKPGRVHLLIGPPIPVTGRTLEDRDALMAEARTIIADLRTRAKAVLAAEAASAPIA